MAVVGLMPRTHAVSRTPLPLRLSSITCCLTWGERPFVGGIEQEGLVGAGGIEAAVALPAGVGRAACDHVLALTVETAHGQEGHGLPCHQKEPP